MKKRYEKLGVISISKVNVLHISGKTSVLSLSLSSVSCFLSIKRYQYGALIAFVNVSIINSLLPGTSDAPD